MIRKLIGISEIDFNNITNICNLCHTFDNEDLQLRKEAFDRGNSHLGIVRRISILPDIWLEIGARPGLCLLGELSD